MKCDIFWCFIYESVKCGADMTCQKDPIFCSHLCKVNSPRCLVTFQYAFSKFWSHQVYFSVASFSSQCGTRRHLVTPRTTWLAHRPVLRSPVIVISEKCCRSDHLKIVNTCWNVSKYLPRWKRYRWLHHWQGESFQFTCLQGPQQVYFCSRNVNRRILVHTALLTAPILKQMRDAIMIG